MENLTFPTLLLFCSLTCFAQQAKLDSLLKINAEYSKEDNTKVDILNNLAEVYEWMQVDSGLVCADRAVALARKLNNQKGLADAYLNKVNLLHYHGKIEEREKLLEKVSEINAKLNDNNILAEYYLQLARARFGEERIALSRKALELYSQTKNELGIGRASFYLGRHRGGINGKNSVQCVHDAREIFQKLGNLPLLGFSWCETGMQTDETDFMRVEECGKTGLRIAQKANIPQVMGSAYFVLAYIYRVKGKYALSLENWLNSLKIAEQVGSVEKQVVVSGNIGQLLLHVGKFEESLKYTKHAYNLAKQAGLLNQLTFIAGNLGIAYTAQKKYAEAKQVYSESLEYSILTHDEDRASEARCFLAEIELKLGNYQQSLAHLRSADTLAKKLHSTWNVDANFVTKALVIKHAPDALLIKEGFSPTKRDRIMLNLLQECLKLNPNNPDGLFEISELYQKLGDNKNALLYFKKYTAGKDNQVKIANENSLTSLQIDYEVGKKEAEIALLNKDNELQNKELQRQKLVRNGFISGFAVVLLFSVLFLFQRNNIKKGKKLSDNLLLNILPAEVAEELKAKGSAEAKHFDNVTVLFSDFVGFTKVSESLIPQELVNELHACFKGFDEICGKYNIEKIKTIGDAYLAVCGLPLADEKHAEKVVNAALEIREFMQNRRHNLGEKTFEIRIGIHSGSVVAGIVGVKKYSYDIWGDTVNTAARMEQNSEAGKINISEATYELVKDNFSCIYRGEIDAKNKGKLKMYFVKNGV